VQLGQPALAAWLMPLSVDGAVGAASTALLAAARSGDRSPATARVMLALGVLATLTANAYSGAGHGVAGMALAMWPGVAFVGSAETALSMVRRSARTDTASQPVTADALALPSESVSRPAIGVAWPRPALAAADQPEVRPSGRSRKPGKPNRRAATIVARQPDISGSELGRKLGVSERTGRRLLAQVASS
jgi:hypothetical protein